MEANNWEANDWERNVILSSLEIAWMVLGGHAGESAREHVLNSIDVNDNEADVLEANIEAILNEEGVITSC